ncbi:MAG TPA: hypothetical protein VN719_14895, partial [Gemmatimonadales bacterium]|nr:hypothetical protein [Gemmatimonadales bacterium]
MIKLLLPGGWDFGEPQSALVKWASRGLIGADRKALEKRAGERFVAELPEVKRAKDEEIVHMIAMGSTEAYSNNRNGDGFRELHLKNSHDTFRKYAKPFRDHRNRPTDPYYGRVIKSAYYDPMRRVELLVGYNGGPASIEQNGGRLADLELDKLASSTDLPVSMSCRVAHDVCSGCGNKARSRAEYCDEHSGCKYGGLKAHIAETFEDGHTLHADNPDPKFFDISYVPKPADRIAYALGTLYKAASADWSPYDRYHCNGAALAESMDLRLPATLWDELGRDFSGRLKLAAEMAQAERAFDH